MSDKPECPDCGHAWAVHLEDLTGTGLAVGCHERVDDHPSGYCPCPNVATGGPTDLLAVAHKEIERLTGILKAVAAHGATVWPNTACGRGGIAGQAVTTTVHPEAFEHLVAGGLQGQSLKDIADSYAAMWGDGVARLDEPPRPTRRAGQDGRPV